MVSDDERRRVAERLRMSDERDAAGFVDCLLAEVVRGREFCETPCEHCHGRLLGELADLIEPSCDRDALLALADEIEASARHLNVWQGPFLNANDVRVFARRIREALEVSDDA